MWIMSRVPMSMEWRQDCHDTITNIHLPYLTGTWHLVLEIQKQTRTCTPGIEWAELNHLTLQINFIIIILVMNRWLLVWLRLGTCIWYFSQSLISRRYCLRFDWLFNFNHLIVVSPFNILPFTNKTSNFQC